MGILPSKEFYQGYINEVYLFFYKDIFQLETVGTFVGNHCWPKIFGANNSYRIALTAIAAHLAGFVKAIRTYTLEI